MKIISIQYQLIASLSWSRRRTDAQTESKIQEKLATQPFSETIGKMIGGRNMKNSKMTESHLVSKKMNAHLDMLGALMLKRFPER